MQTAKTPWQLWHNPRCSKSRQAKSLLESRQVPFQVFAYLETPPDPRQLKAVLGKLGMDPREIIRTREACFQESGLQEPDLSDSEIIERLCQYPVLIERPILVGARKAAVGRPPENIIKLLEETAV